MTLPGEGSVTSGFVEAEDGREDDGPLFAWLPPEDRLWRHPSEVGASAAERAASAWRRPSGARVWTVALVAGVFGAILASGVGLATGMFVQRTVTVPVPLPVKDTSAATTTAAQEATPSWATVANEVAPSVVGITAGGQAGSGIVYTASQGTSYILTAADVVSGVRKVGIVWDDGTRQPGYVVGTDPVSGVAVVRVQGAGHPPATFGTAANLQIASGVLAVAGRNTGAASVAPGNLSGLDTELQAPDNYTLQGMMAVTGLTVPASADGGALVDQNAEVVGINTDLTSVDSSMQGVAFAVPIDTARDVANQLLAGRKPVDPWIGVQDATDVSPMTASERGISGGAMIGSVAPGSPAARAGLHAGDIVTAFDGQQVTSAGALISALATCRPDDHAHISYLDGPRLHRASLTVGQLSAAA